MNSTTSGSQEQFIEFLARPAYFNSAYSSPLGRNHWSLQTMEYFEDHGWFSGKDILKLTADVFPQKGYISRYCANKVKSAIPLQWKKGLQQ